MEEQKTVLKCFLSRLKKDAGTKEIQVKYLNLTIPQPYPAEKIRVRVSCAYLDDNKEGLYYDPLTDTFQYSGKPPGLCIGENFVGFKLNDYLLALIDQPLRAMLQRVGITKKDGLFRF